MRSRVLPSLVLFGAAFALPGCIEMDVSTELKADGSGTFGMSMKVTDKMVEITRKLAKIDPSQDPLKDMGPMNLKKPDAATLAEMEKAGLKVLELESQFDETRMGMKVKVAFDRLAALAHMDRLDPEGERGGGPGEDMRLTRAKDGVYTYSLSMEPDSKKKEKKEPPGLEVPEPPAEKKEKKELTKEEQAKQMQEAMALAGEMMGEASKLKISFSIRVPGEIVDFQPTAGGKKEEGRVTWTYDFATMMQLAMESNAAGEEGDSDNPFKNMQVRFRMPEGQSIPEAALWNGPPAAPAAPETPPAPATPPKAPEVPPAPPKAGETPK